MNSLDHRLATLDDIPLLVEMNLQLTQDEQHRNRFQDRAWFEARMRGFLADNYQAVIFERAGRAVAYALFCPQGDDTIYLRQIFVARDCRRQGIGRQAIALLCGHYWPPDRRITLGVLATNTAAPGDWLSAVFAHPGVAGSFRARRVNRTAGHAKA